MDASYVGGTRKVDWSQSGGIAVVFVPSSRAWITDQHVHPQHCRDYGDNDESSLERGWLDIRHLREHAHADRYHTEPGQDADDAGEHPSLPHLVQIEQKAGESERLQDAGGYGTDRTLEIQTAVPMENRLVRIDEGHVVGSELGL